MLPRFPATLFSPLVERAMRAAARFHRAQTRKASDLPYISHPASVALILSQAGFSDPRVLAAALLHDAVEDTECSLDDLRRDGFPGDVIAWVAAATEQKLDDGGRKRPWAARKAEHITQVAAAPLEARAVVLADKLHNLGTILYDFDNPDLWQKFGAAPAEILRYHRDMLAQAGQDEGLRPLREGCERLLDELKLRLGLS